MCGAHTDKAGRAEMNQNLGTKYKGLVQEYQMIQDKIKSINNFQQEVKVQKMVQNEERIRQNEQVSQFYKEQIKAIDKDVQKILYDVGDTDIDS